MEEIIASNSAKVQGYERLKRLLGKKVIAKNGEVVGKVRDIAIENYDIKGVFCSRWFDKVYIDKSNFETFSADAIVLRINPVTLLKGKIVFDSAGKRVGTVRRVNRDDTSNSFKSLAVRTKIYKRKIEIKPGQISILKKNIILKTEYEG